MKTEPYYWEEFLKWEEIFKKGHTSAFEYEVEDEGIVIKNDIEWHGMNLEKLPFPITRVEGAFSIKGNLFKTLLGFPKVVTGAFNASFNQIEDPSGCPQSPLINLSHNKLVHCKLGVPICDGVWFYNNNDLSSIEGAPSTTVEFNTFLGKTHITNKLVCDFTNIPKEDIEIYDECQVMDCWSHESTLLDNLGKLVRKNPKIVEKKWKLLESLDSSYRKYFFGANMGLI